MPRARGPSRVDAFIVHPLLKVINHLAIKGDLRGLVIAEFPGPADRRIGDSPGDQHIGRLHNLAQETEVLLSKSCANVVRH